MAADEEVKFPIRQVWHSPAKGFTRSHTAAHSCSRRRNFRCRRTTAAVIVRCRPSCSGTTSVGSHLRLSVSSSRRRSRRTQAAGSSSSRRRTDRTPPTGRMLSMPPESTTRSSSSTSAERVGMGRCSRSWARLLDGRQYRTPFSVASPSAAATSCPPCSPPES